MRNGPNATVRPAEELVGLSLADDWRVVAKIPKDPQGTGGYFSVPYVAERPDGTRAFLKAVNLSLALSSPGMMRNVEALTKAFNFEVDVLSKCRRMTNIVRVLAHGEAEVPGSVIGNVPYLIFEYADHGDVRKRLSLFQEFDLAWTLRSLHNVANGLRQLHGAGIAHQDLKPSNVLVFDGSIKISDLGRASDFSVRGPHDGLDFAGDLTYAPPEALYGFQPNDWHTRRFGADLYMLGSMIVFMCSGVSMSALLYKGLAPEFHPGRVPFAEAMPYLEHALSNALAEFAAALPDKRWASEISLVVERLCCVNPQIRGTPGFLRGNLSLEPFVSALNRLARRAELGMTR